MKQLLKQVQEIYPNAYIPPAKDNYICIRHKRLIIDFDGDLEGRTVYYFNGVNSNICISRDFNKILAVLKALKQCNKGDEDEI